MPVLIFGFLNNEPNSCKNMSKIHGCYTARAINESSTLHANLSLEHFANLVRHNCVYFDDYSGGKYSNMLHVKMR